MIDLNALDIDTLIGQASITAIKEPLTRHIVSFGFIGKDVTQVQTMIKDIGGSETRTEMDYYFIPTQELDKALIIAKAMATLDFMNLPYPLMSERAPVAKEEPKNVETQSKVSEEVGSESSEDQGPSEPVDKKPRKPRGPNKPKVEVAPKRNPVQLPEESPSQDDLLPEKNKFVGDLYDTSKQAHKDAFILLLDKEFPTWRTMGKEKSKAMSAALVGQVFLSNTGVVVASFKEQVAAHVKAALE